MAASGLVTPGSSAGITGQTTATRALSLDIFRGFTMAVMIFVNDLSDVKGLPAWTYHYPANVDAMSYVDMVFPFFLFAVGLALPLATRQRLRRDPSMARLWGHILQRCLALLVLGLILANTEHVRRPLTHMRGSVWATLALCGAILLWAVYPSRWPRARAWSFRVAGAALLVAMLAIFRTAGADGRPAWLVFRYPEILGLISLAYLATCLLYLPTRSLRWAPLAWFAVLIGLNIAFLAHWLASPSSVYVTPFGNGAMAAIVMAGVVVSGLFLPAEAAPGRRTPFLGAMLFALGCAALGYVLQPLGISKIRATPSWVLWSVAAATVLFALFFYLLDVRKRIWWAAPFRAPGSNTLLTYLLPDLFLYTLAICGLRASLGRWNAGAAGVVRCLLFTGVILGASYLLTRARIRLQL